MSVNNLWVKLKIAVLLMVIVISIPAAPAWAVQKNSSDV